MTNKITDKNMSKDQQNAKAEALAMLQDEQLIELLARYNATAQLGGVKTENGTAHYEVTIKWQIQ